MEIAIPKSRFAEPRRNLPSWKGLATREDRFTISFARAYAEQAQRIHRKTSRTQMALAREIRVNGYGIADLVAVAWPPSSPLRDELSAGEGLTIRAFECKMKDWRSALGQAARYRFFANQAIVVLPAQVVKSALPFLETFRKTGIGLWSFNPLSGTIQVHHTPRNTKAKSPKYIPNVVRDVHKATRTIPPIQETGRFPSP